MRCRRLPHGKRRAGLLYQVSGFRKTYVIEVKAGKNSSKTAIDVLENGKADCLLMAKGNTHGGKIDRVYTIPVYGISKFIF